METRVNKETEEVEKIFPELDEMIKEKFNIDKDVQYEKLVEQLKKELK